MRQLHNLENPYLKENTLVQTTLKKEGALKYKKQGFLKQSVTKSLKLEIKKKPVQYFGTVDEVTGEPEGLGMFIYADGSVYEGFVREGLKEKYGR